MLPSKVDPLIKLTSELLDIPYSLTRDMVYAQFLLIKEYSQGKLDIPALDLKRLGRFGIKINPLNFVISQTIPRARLHEHSKQKLHRLWKLRKHAKNYEHFKSYKRRLGSWHCGRPAD